MKVLALDLSTKTGYALFESHFVEGSQRVSEPKLVEHGQVLLGQPILAYGPYPWCFVTAAERIGAGIHELATCYLPDVFVIEETNLGRNRYSQKALEFIHFSVLKEINAYFKEIGSKSIIYYISSSSWRKTLGLSLTKEDKKSNTKLSKAKSLAKSRNTKLDKKALGIKGRINKKHIALRFVNHNYNLNFKVKDNDTADAICLGLAYYRNAATCDGT